MHWQFECWVYFGMIYGHQTFGCRVYLGTMTISLQSLHTRCLGTWIQAPWTDQLLMLKAVTRWHLENELVSDLMKTVLVTGTRKQLARLTKATGVLVASIHIPFSYTLKILIVFLGGKLPLDNHISIVASLCNYHTRASVTFVHLSPKIW